MGNKRLLDSITRFLKDLTFLELTNDLAFKALLTKHEVALKSILSHFLPFSEDSTILNIEVNNPELLPEGLNPSEETKKTFFLDLKVTLLRKISGGEKIKEKCNVEIQALRQECFLERILTYASRVYSEQVSRGEDYKEQTATYSLVFIKEDITELKKVKDFYHIFDMRRRGEYDIFIPNGIFLIFVELAKFRANSPKGLDLRDTWCYILKNSRKMKERDCKDIIEKGGEMPKVLEGLRDVSQDQRIRELSDARYREISDRVTNERVRREEGIKIGLVRGRQEGLIKGREEGKKEGREEAIVEMALDLLKSKADIDLVLKTTGLTKKELESLQKKK